MVAPLVLPLEHVPNPRDLGSYRGIDGRMIKKHRLLRTGKLFEMPKSDENYLLDYGLNTIIDLRTPQEIKNMPDTTPTGVKHLVIPVHEDEKIGVPDETKEQLRSAYDKDQYAGFKVMCYQYRKTVRSKHSQHAFHEVLENMASNQNGATIFHCSEGKDRTGFTAIYLLHILGVDLETIRQDYLYSNYMLNDYRAKLDKKARENGANEFVRANIRSLGSVANEYFDTAMILINKDYGGLDKYLHDEIGVDQDMVDQLRNIYLEPKKA